MTLVAGRIMFPKDDVPVLVPGYCVCYLTQKWDFVDVMKLRILVWEIFLTYLAHPV